MAIYTDTISTTTIHRQKSYQQMTPHAFVTHADIYPKWFMQTEDGTSYAGGGIAHMFSSLPDITFTTQDSPLIFHTQDFLHSRKTIAWNLFPQKVTALPHIEVHSNNNIYTNGEYKPFSLSTNSRSIPPAHAMYHTPSHEEWKNMLSKRSHPKVVFARASTFETTTPIHPISILSQLQKGNIFFCQLDPSTAFLGSSPEFLFRIKEQTVCTHALAGTSTTNSFTPTNFSEVNFVKEDLIQKLSPLCSKLSTLNTPKIISSGTLAHLAYPFVGQLACSAQTLLDTLHPTPAVGGTPQVGALEQIFELEPFDRGWYAAPFVMHSAHKTEAIVSIRSARIEKNELTAYAGAGIVDGCIPEKEWEELNLKIAQWKHIMAGASSSLRSSSPTMSATSA